MATRPDPVVSDWGEKFGRDVVEIVRDHVSREIHKLESRLEERVKSLEARPTLEYRGVWSGDLTYSKGNVVTDGGSMWFCNRETRARPGTSGCWTLAVKKGADAK
ncbi:hypothetical protein [Hansschlegelia sp. KR7-227]|uniref:hypothetical protein n=1 Tax=Hansschlegelia sp. KR7-227 TaxID=3400914 RepID=UPI003C01E08D